MLKGCVIGLGAMGSNHARVLYELQEEAKIKLIGVADIKEDRAKEVAKKYGAVCTPDPFLFDKDFRLVFHGRIDNAMKPEDKATEKTMILNIEKLLAEKKIEKDFDPSMGCSIKWKSQQT